MIIRLRPLPYTLIPAFISEKLIWPQKILKFSSNFPPLLWGDDAIAVHIESETQKNTANIYIAEITEID